MTTSTTSRFPSLSRRMRLPSRAAWLGARATNVLRRPQRIAALGSAAFVALLATYLLLPRGAAGVRALLNPPVQSRVDTMALLARLASTKTQVQQAESGLRNAHEAMRRAVEPPVAAAIPFADRVRRDSLGQSIASLATLLQRAATAPLAESYRALGESGVLRGDPRVRALVDSLIDVEKERDDLGGGVTVDPVYVALTTRANALGRAIQAIGEDELVRLQRDADAMTALDAPAAVAVPSPSLPDTGAAAKAVVTATSAMHLAEHAVASARLTNAARDSIAARERGRAQLAPIPVLLAGAAVVAVFLALSIILADEMRSPRVADSAEAERLCGLRVLAVARLRSVPSDRMRREADRAIARLLDPTADEYRILAWHLTSFWPREGIVSVTGDNPIVAAIVAANLAAVLAVDARATLLVDTDFRAEPVRGVLDLPNSPGLAAVVENRRKWSESLLSVAVGRSRSMVVLPSGMRDRPIGPAESQALVNDILRAARRHDATVVVGPGQQLIRTRAGDDVIVCVVRGATRLATLGRAVASLIDAGARVRGIVLWEGRVPALAHSN
ncbi:MAG: hypothetical protein ACT4P7_09150 [Gemmatimonadaceae bacterium]